MTDEISTTVFNAIFQRLSQLEINQTNFARDIKHEFEKRDGRIQKLENFMYRFTAFVSALVILWHLFGAYIQAKP